ncbi:MAG: FMN-binding protein [Candidatus Latescibacteria bacterium]|jgi:hypothetical protein|nr:FMN-binding protein [Candidatus Latescibacterota bacterium]
MAWKSCLVRAALLLLFGCLLSTPTSVSAKVFITVDEALRLAFPDCAVERTTIYLTQQQITDAAGLSNSEITSAIVHPYVAKKDGSVIGTAYFDAHIVRTLPETIMVVVNSKDRVKRIELLSFNEPTDYIPKDVWYQQFVDQHLHEALVLKRDIRQMAGATLTARVTTDAVRRVLAVHQILKDGIGK